jgi:Archaeal transcriptional regulator TrmB.
VTEPASLPLTEANFRTTVVEATLRCRKETPLTARIEGRWTDTHESVDLECRIVGVTQGLIEPTNSQFPIEASLTVDADGETYTVGGEGAFIEDIEAERVTLREQ